MHATHRSETHEVELLVVGLHIVICSLDLRILEELVLAGCDVDLHEVLINDTTCAEVEVSDLRVTHLAFRKLAVPMVASMLKPMS